MDGQQQKGMIIYGLALGVVLGMIVVNAKKTITVMGRTESPLTASSHYPGEVFVLLPKDLTDVDTVGYVTNYTSSIYEQDRPAVFNYHQAKFAMAPVILDRFNPWAHDYVLLYFFPSKDFAPIFIPWPHRIIHKVNDNVLLIQKINTH